MSDVFCESTANSHKSTCTWTINGWESTMVWTPDMKLTSKIFSSVTNHGTKWCLEIHPMGATREEVQNRTYVQVNYVSVHLRLMSVKHESVARAHWVLYGLNEENEKVTLVTMNLETFDINTKPRIGKDDALKRSDLSNTSKYGVVLGDKLRLVCEVSECDISCYLGTPTIIVPECRIVDDYSILFETKALSDVKIIAKGNVEFEAHKTILAVRSPVFTAMFKHETTERSNNCVKIMDTDPKVLEEMLRFIYTGEVGDIDEIVEDLLGVADKYDLPRLKIMCEEKLCATLNIENAAHIFMIADRYKCNQLKALTTSFIIEHGKDVIQTEGYSLIIESHHHLANNLLRGIFS